MLVVLYRWRVKPDFKSQFVEAWSEITDYLRKNHDSLGSRLHRGSDGIWYGYAQWKSAEQREKAFASDSKIISEASRRMREAVAENFPETTLDVISDYLILPDET